MHCDIGGLLGCQMKVVSPFLLAGLAARDQSWRLQQCSQDVVEGQFFEFHIGLNRESRWNAVERGNSMGLKVKTFEDFVVVANWCRLPEGCCYTVVHTFLEFSAEMVQWICCNWNEGLGMNVDECWAILHFREASFNWSFNLLLLRFGDLASL